MESSPAIPAPILSEQGTLCATLRLFVRTLLAALGAWRLEPMIAIAAYRRISSTMSRLERMLVRFRAGRLRVLPQRNATPRLQPRCKAEAVLPRRFGWLVQLGGTEAACFGSQLQTALNMPEMTELLAASVQAQRILRPLCRALAVELPWVVAKAVRLRGEKPRRVRKPRVKPEPFRIPLPRGVLAAARRQGFGKMR